MFNNFSFKAKLLSLCIFLTLICVSVGGIGFYGLANVGNKYEFILEKTQPKLDLAFEMFMHYRRVRITLRTLGLPGITPEIAEQAIQEAQEAISNFDKTNQAYVALGFIPGQKELHDKLDAAWADFKVTGATVISLYKSGKAEDREKMIKIFFEECPAKAKIFTAAGDALVVFHKKISAQKAEEANSAAKQANTTALIAILLGCSLGLGIGFVFATKVATSISRIIEKLSENAAQVSSASAQIASSSEELSQATSEQAASLEETASSVEEMSSMVGKSADNAKATASSSAASEKKASEGKQVIESMLTSMSEINQSNMNIMGQINTSNQQMVEIVKVIQEIGEKTKVINDIVFQTKLLSFNASVEAARAGEHGKGFAVVAEEVGNLAAMSGNAAKEISTMLEGSMHKVKTIVDETKQKVEALVGTGKEKVDAGTAVARKCAEVFDEIVVNVSSTSTMAGEISQASQEQSHGIQEITKAMTQLDQVTQQNAATAEEAASSAEELSAQAESLKQAVDELTATMSGSAKRHAPAPVAVPAKKAEMGEVIQLKQKVLPARQLKAAAGDGTIPLRSHPEFQDV